MSRPRETGGRAVTLAAAAALALLVLAAFGPVVTGRRIALLAARTESPVVFYLVRNVVLAAV